MPTDSFTPALARLDPAHRALLDLSLRRGMRPEEIGDLLGTDPESVIVAREAALEQLGAELGLDETPDLDELRARLAALPSEAWTPPAEEEEEPAERPQLTVVEAPAEPADEAREEARKPAGGRKSRLPLLLTLLALAAVVLVIVLASSGGDDENAASSTPAPAPKSQKPGAKKSGEPGAKPSKPAASSTPEAKLTPVGGAGGATGSAQLTDGGKRLKLDVSGLPAGSYEVWLYDSVIDAQSIGKATGTKITLDVELPGTASKYRYVDVSREPADGNPNHSGESVLRVPLSRLAP